MCIDQLSTLKNEVALLMGNVIGEVIIREERVLPQVLKLICESYC